MYFLIPQHQAALVLGNFREAVRETSQKKKKPLFNRLARVCKDLGLVNGEVEFIGEVLDSAGEAHLLVASKKSDLAAQAKLDNLLIRVDKALQMIKYAGENQTADLQIADIEKVLKGED